MSTLAPHLTELSKVFQAECFNFAQIKDSAELCINKLSDAAAKSELETNCEKFGCELGELITPDGLVDSRVSSDMVFYKGTERLANWPFPYTKREAGVCEPTTTASPFLVSQEECMPRWSENNWTQTAWCPMWFSSQPWHYRKNFHSPANFREILGVCKRRIDMFCRPRKSIWLSSSWKALGGVLCKSSVDGCVLLCIKQLYSCSEDCVRVDGVKSQSFSVVVVGLRQWRVLSPFLFIV